jgi:hypothetical protein
MVVVVMLMVVMMMTMVVVVGGGVGHERTACAPASPFPSISNTYASTRSTQRFTRMVCTWRLDTSQ